MGPQQLLADVFRPLTPELSAPPNPRLEQSAGRFGDYLRDARTDGVARRPEQSDEPSALDEGEELEPKEATNQNDERVEESSDDAAELSGIIAESGATAFSLAAQNEDARVFVEPFGAPAGETTQTLAGEVSSQAEISNSKSPVDTESQIANPLPIESDDALETARAQSGAVSITEEAAAAQVDGAAERGRAGRQASFLETAQVHEPAPLGPITRRDLPGTGSNQPPLSETVVDGSVPKNLSKQNQADVIQPVVRSDTDRRAGEADTVSVRSDRSVDDAASLGRRSQVIGEAGGKDKTPIGRPPLKSGHPAAAGSLKTISLRGGQGDGTAASVARFLVGGIGSGTSATEGAGVAAANAGSGSFQSLNGVGSSVTTTSSAMVDDLLAARIEGAEVIDRVARVLNASNGMGRQSVTMQLDPPELGQLRLQIQMNQQGVTLHIDTQTKDVARLIEARMADLHESLSAHGIHIQRANVVVRSPASGGADPQPQGQGQPSGSGLGQGTSDGQGSGFSDGGQRQMPGEGALPQGQAIGGERLMADDHVDMGSDVGTMLDTKMATSELSVDLVA